MRALILDPFAGISGDMMLGALIDIGLDPDWLREFVASLGLAGVRVEIGRVNRRAISCGRVTFELPPQHTHRHLRHVLEIVDGSPATERARGRARDAFERIARAEAHVHDTTVEKVHFHEVGALDSILDVLCTMEAIEQLGYDAVYTRPIAVGHGWVDIEHGRFPVPAPATLHLLEGLPLTGFDLEGECTTPTGAAIVATLSGGRSAPAQLVATASGFGAGTRDPASHPNCLRLVSARVEPGADDLLLVQSDIDDMTPEYLPAAQQALLDAGAVDVTVSSISMKKGRPGMRIEALVPTEARDVVLETLFRNTSTIGARYWAIERPALARREEVVEWNGQEIRVKTVSLPGGGERSKPELDDVVRAATALGLTAIEVERQVTALRMPRP
jgi:pyridinium-3,5-bisthiocarboxylic acid mononucleotide nickel chelatase